MRFLFYFLFVSCLSVDVARAQRINPDDSRLYLGLQASYMHYPGLNFGYIAEFPSFKAIYPLAGTLGYRLSSGFSIELGFTGRSPAEQSASDGTHTEVYSSYAYAASFLMRQSILHPARSTPWNIDVVGGFVILKGAQRVVDYYQNSGTQYEAGSSAAGIDDAQFALGLGVRYRLGPYWQLTGDVQGQVSLISSVANSALGTHLEQFGAGASVGIRYSLWRRGK